MSKARKSKKSSIDFVRDAEDVRVACYHRQNYALDKLQAPYLAWFIQIAIRRDLMICEQGLFDTGDPLVVLQGYSEIVSKLDELKELIRQRHIVDEADLGSIGMTLYNFPALSHFFVVPEEQAFVREATLKEVRNALDDANVIVRHSRLAAFVSGDLDDHANEEHIANLTNRMTITRLKVEAGLDAEEISKEKLLLVDMGAPVQILAKQFLKILERQPKLKRSPYADWKEYGILPFMDLSQWEKGSGVKIKPDVRVELIYPHRLAGYTAKKLDETTIPHTHKLLDSKGPVFLGLLADASEEYRQVIASVGGDEPLGKDPVVEEALARWFPRTFPYDMSAFERAAQVFPEKRGKIQWVTGQLEKDGRLNLPITEHIRTMPTNTQGTAMLRAMKELESHDADVVSTLPGEEGFPRLCPDDDVYDCNNTQPEGRRYQPGWSERDTDLLKEVMAKMGLPCPTEPLPEGADPRMLAVWSDKDLNLMKEMFAGISTSLQPPR